MPVLRGAAASTGDWQYFLMLILLFFFYSHGAACLSGIKSGILGCWYDWRESFFILLTSKISLDMLCFYCF